jgi:hypothetical protein
LIERPAETNENQTASIEGIAPVSANMGETVQTASFIDETSGEFLSFPEPTSSVFKEDAQLGVDLGNFLSRPTLIKTFSWLESGFGETSFDPWTLFLSNAQIKNKLNNFAFFARNIEVEGGYECRAVLLRCFVDGVHTSSKLCEFDVQYF